MKRLFLLIFICFVSLLSLAQAQGDDVFYNESAKLLSYTVDYERLSVNAEARECSNTAFESGLLHSVLRDLFLFLPFEASFYPAVDTVEVIVNQEDELVLYAKIPVEEIRTTNKRFRVFMNSFASPRAGFCFSISQNTLELWINTLNARNGILVYAPEFFSLSIPGAISFEDYAKENTLPSVVVGSIEEASQGQAAESEEPQTAVEPQTAAEPEPQLADPVESSAAAETVIPADANAYRLTPFISDLAVRVFAGPEDVLEPNTDYAALIETTKGQLFIDLFEGIAPETVNNFVFLARNHYFDGMSFFRVLEGFMAQTGDPSGSGIGGPGYQIPDEIVEGIGHSAPGIVSMANAGPGTAGSQFFITMEEAPWLDGSYSIFGAVLEGLEVLPNITITDPSQPFALATPDTTLGLLTMQGVELAGSSSYTIDSYLLEKLGRLPVLNQRVSLDGYDLMVTTDPQTENRVVAFWPESDKITAVTIVQRAK
ncbi:MAG: peptidylprolyl isomerase [Trueperaceae bacterium]|nr:peptidylprolyl isomerase [Trueperaceae bacterium]